MFLFSLDKYPLMGLLDHMVVLGSYAGEDKRQEEKGTTEDEMIGWHHWPNGHKFEQALGDGEGQGSVACCSPQAHKESDMTEWMNNNGRVCFFFWGASILFSIVAAPIYIPTNSARGFPFLHILANTRFLPKFLLWLYITYLELFQTFEIHQLYLAKFIQLCKV